jgi:hypothetical protein
LNKAIWIAKASETVKQQTQELLAGGNELQTASIMFQNKKDDVHKSRIHSKCIKCNGVHGYRKCPAICKTCYNCQKANHFEICCKAPKRDKQNVNELITDNDNKEDGEENAEEYFLGSIEVHIIRLKLWILMLNISGSLLPVKLDTGAQVNIISDNDFKKLIEKPYLHKTGVCIQAYGKNNLKVMGKCIMTVKLNDFTHNLCFM